MEKVMETKCKSPFATCGTTCGLAFFLLLLLGAQAMFAEASENHRPIDSLGVESAIPAGEMPRDYAKEQDVAPSGIVGLRTWPIQTRWWVATASHHRPLYFEEVNAERYGYTRSRLLQPAISTVHFFGTVPYLPYLMATDCPRDCVYTLGHYRPGSCVPYRQHAWPISIKGASAEAAAVVGIIALFP